jgi:hypothetical protein
LRSSIPRTGGDIWLTPQVDLLSFASHLLLLK